MTLKNLLCLSLLSLFFVSPLADANTGEVYGYGSQSMALGNTMLGGKAGGFGTYYNPALNSDVKGLTASYGMTYMNLSFPEVKGVTVGNYATTAQDGDVIGDMDTTYLEHYGQVMAASLNFGENLKNLNIGVLAFLPFTRLAYIDTGEPFSVEYFNYRSRTQRPQMYSSLGFSPLKFLHVAAGMAFGTNVAASTKVTYASTASTVSYQRLNTTVKSSASPFGGIYFNPKPFELGVTVRRQNRQTISLETTANARFLGNTSELRLATSSSSTIFYDPFEVDTAFALNVPYSDPYYKTWVSVEVDWLQYKAYEGPNIAIVDRGSSGITQKSVSTTPTMQNIWVPKFGFEQGAGCMSGRLGYSYRPTPVKSNAGPGNLVDPAKHMFSIGWGLDFARIEAIHKPVTLDLHGQYHYLVRQKITKSGGNEVGTAGQSKVGSSGYEIGGNIYGGGFSITVQI